MAAAFMPTPNAQGECCPEPCVKDEPCASCCPCDPLPDSVLVVQYREELLGEAGCKRKVWVVVDCDSGIWDGAACIYLNNFATLEFLEEPLGAWSIGEAVAETPGCEGLHGFYLDASGGIAYLVTTPDGSAGTIDGGLVESDTCEPCAPVEVEDCWKRETCRWE